MGENQRVDLRAAMNAISDVIQNRPRPLRNFDQIYMKAGDMVMQSELIARWADGKRMGQTITSVTDMVSYAGDLRRAAKQAPTPEESAKLQQSATTLEQKGLAQVGQAGPGIGRLLDTFV